MKVTVGLNLMEAELDARALAKSWTAFADSLAEDSMSREASGEISPEADHELAAQFSAPEPIIEGEVIKAGDEVQTPLGPAIAVESTAAPEPEPIVPVVQLEPKPLEAGLGPEAKLDTAGNPWIIGIHTDSRTTMANGEWKFKRGINREEAVATVAAAKEALAAPEPAAAPEAVEPAAVPEPAPVPIAPVPVAPVPAPVIPTPPVEAPVAAPTAQVTTFPELMVEVVAATKTKKIAHADIDEYAKSLGLKGLVFMNQASPENLQALMGLINAHIAKAPAG